MTGVEIAAYAALAAAAVSAVSAYSQGVQQKKIMEYNAKVAENDAAAKRAQAEAMAEQKRRDTYRLMGSMRAGYAKAGVELSGTPLDTIEDAAMEAELDAQTILWNGKYAASQLEAQANIDRYRGSTAYANGIMSAGGSILGGVSNYYMIRSMPPKVTTAPDGGSGGGAPKTGNDASWLGGYSRGSGVG